MPSAKKSKYPHEDLHPIPERIAGRPVAPKSSGEPSADAARTKGNTKPGVVQPETGTSLAVLSGPTSACEFGQGQ